MDRHKSITWRELRAIRRLLSGSFARYVSDPTVCRLLVHEENQAVISILNAMVSASKAMMTELLLLQRVLTAKDITIESPWILSAVNSYAEYLSGTRDPSDVRVSRSLVVSVQDRFRLNVEMGI